MLHLVQPPAESPATDEALADQACAGSVAAFEVLVRRYEGRLIAFLGRRTGRPQDARDLAQDAFVRAWERRGTYISGRRFAPWMFTIAARVATDAWRRDRRSRDQHPARPAPRDDGELQVLDHAAQRASIWELADRELPSHVVEALWLRYVAELDAAQVGKVLGRSAVAVRVMLMRARRVLAQHLDAQAGHPAERSDEAGTPAEIHLDSRRPVAAKVGQ